MNSDSNIYVCTSGRIYTCRLLIGAMQGSKLSKSRINLVEVQDISSNAAASNGQKKKNLSMPEEEKIFEENYSNKNL